MLRDLISLGDKIDIRKLDHMGKPLEFSRQCVSQLLDYIDEENITIAVPMIGGKIYPLEPGSEYHLCFYTKRGLYQCSAVIQGIYMERHVIAASVKLTSGLEKFQRRQYYRLECMIDILYRTISLEESILETKLINSNFPTPEAKAECQEKLKNFNKDWMKGMILDISGGGARFNSECSHQPEDKIRMTLELASSKVPKKYILNAKIVTSEKVINKSNLFEHRVEFTDITKKDREDIIKYIFEQERLRRKTTDTRNT